MRMTLAVAALAACTLAPIAGGAVAQTAGSTFEKKNYNYGEWTKGRFSEAVTVTGPARMIFLAGVGSEEAMNGQILHPGDFMAQCRYAYEKIKNVLAKHGATLGDVVKMTTYVTDVRFQADAGKCRSDNLGDLPRPAHTFLTISQLAWPHMLVEIDVIAMVPLDRPISP
jgi:enamine deaminase RidA (YjgF/YER057c/UK114 family)